MKRTLPLALLVGFTSAAWAQTILINENFDSYTVGAMIAQSNPTNWNTWGGTPGGADDSPISNAITAHSGANTVEFVASGAGGGPADVLLLLGDKTSGSYSLSWWMYVPTGFGGYFNIQHTEDVSSPQFAAEVIFGDGGAISGTVNNTALAGTYPQDSWYMVLLAIDLGTSMAVLTVNGAVVSTWQFDTQTDGTAGLNQLGAIDFYAYGGGAPTIGTYYIDDVLYTSMNVGIEEMSSDDLSTYPNPVTGILTVEISGAGNSPEVTLMDASGRAVEQGRRFSAVNGARQMAIDMSGMPAGMYTLRVLENGKVITRKVVKS